VGARTPHRSSRRRYRRRALDAWVALAGLVVFLLAALGAHGGRVGAVERSVFVAINGLPEWLSPPMVGLQYLGTLVVGPLTALVAAVFRRWRLVGAALAATVLKLFVERAVKAVIHRQRPGVTVSGAILRGDVPPRGYAFVSGHLVLTGALATLITPYLHGRWKVVPWIFVAAVGIARVYLGAHNPLDVVGGAGLGLLIGGVLNLAFGVPVAEVHEEHRPATDRPSPGRA
jgi:membrane-associated phospholipid phosphatase